MMKAANLYYREGSSDKVYHATVEEKDGGHVVNFQYGRRGGHMTTGSKTSGPVSLAEAMKVWEKLVSSKLAKGYRHMTDASQGAIPQVDLPETPTGSQQVDQSPPKRTQCGHNGPISSRLKAVPTGSVPSVRYHGCEVC